MGVPLEKVRVEIAQTGFPLELRVARLLRDRGFTVDHNIYYVDKDEGKGREIEIVASKTSTKQYEIKGSSQKTVLLRLLVECKKTTSPWVFFSSPHDQSENDLTELQVAGLTNLRKIRGQDAERLIGCHPTWPHPRRGRTYFEPFKKIDERRGEGVNANIFKALTTVAKATIEMAGNRKQFNVPVQILQPVVVVDGEIVEAYLNESMEVTPEHQSWLPVSFHYHSPEYASERFNIAVVREPDLWSFLEGIDRFFEAWQEFLMQHPEHFRVRGEAKVFSG